MKNLVLPIILTAVTLVAGCAQFTTSDAELANLKSVADTRADEYIGCMKTEANSVTSSTDYAFIAQAVKARCKSSLDVYKSAQKEYLASQYMMTSKPLAISVADLEGRAENEVAELLVARDANPQSVPAAPPTRAPQLMLPSASVAAASAAAMDVVVKWNPEQRVYLDCMDEQADKYMRLNESAEAIANVAADKCKSYLTVERRAALIEEGKVRVMGKIMDMRLSPR